MEKHNLHNINELTIFQQTTNAEIPVNLSKIATIVTTIAALAFLGCKKKEDSAAQLPPPPTHTVASAANGEPELQPIQSAGQAKGSFGVGKASQSPSQGNYVIQVDIKPSQKAADKVREKLKASGIEAYVAEVENPGELEGTYYRVRIGFFPSIQEATDYAKGTLAPLGFAWWVDLKKNDSVGKSAPSSSPSEYGTPTPASDWSRPAPQAQTPAPEPTPAPVATPAAPEPTPTPVAQPVAPAPQPTAVAPAVAPTPTPTPAAKPATGKADEWQ